MNGEPLQSMVTIRNPQGLHIRPMKAFVELAMRFQSTVHVSRKGGERVDGKSPLGLLGLGAEQGTELILEVCGDDQQQAHDALLALLNTLAAEDEQNNHPTTQVAPRADTGG